MTTQTKLPQSIFPDLPRESPAIDKNGDFTSLWELGLSALFQALQRNFKNEGIVFPNLDSTSISTIQNLYTSYIGGTYNALTVALPDISGQTVFDYTNKVSKQFVIATDTSTPPLVTLAEWVPFAMMLTNAGNPNGVQAGVLNWFCYDTTNKILYICTTAGNSASAVWTAV